MPATSVSWNEAARFVNWLNTSTGRPSAYKFTTDGVNDNIALWTATDTLDYDSANPYRSKRTTYVLPSYNEWYKAAYYAPESSNYYDYPTGSNTAPKAVPFGTEKDTAVYLQTGPTEVTQAGGLSTFGVMGMGGNVYEWEESSFDLSNNNISSIRGLRGSGWGDPDWVLSSATRFNKLPDQDNVSLGFRVASLISVASEVPEPSTMFIGTIFGLGGLIAKRRMKKQPIW
jgi:formylglycine-generating enzyme required for sulfatase activity